MATAPKLPTTRSADAAIVGDLFGFLERGCRHFGFANAAELLAKGDKYSAMDSVRKGESGDRDHTLLERGILSYAIESLWRHDPGRPSTAAHLVDSAMMAAQFIHGAPLTDAVAAWFRTDGDPNWDRQPALADIRTLYRYWPMASPEVQRIAAGLLGEKQGAAWALETAANLAGEIPVISATV